jgi:hypothetical protein
LKLDDYNISIKTYLRMIKVMICLGSYTYTRAMIKNFQILMFQAKSKSEVHKMFTANVGMLSEESGENSFSLLSRSVLGDNHKSDFEHMNKLFALLPVYRNICTDLSIDIHRPLAARGCFGDISPEVRAVKTLVAHIKLIIHKASHNHVTHYDGLKKTYSNATNAMKGQKIPNTVDLLFKVNIARKVQKHVDTCKGDLDTFWLTRYKEQWPEAKLRQPVNNPVLIDVSDSEDGFSDVSVRGDDEFDDHKHLGNDIFDIPDVESISIFPEHKNPIQQIIPIPIPVDPQPDRPEGYLFEDTSTIAEAPEEYDNVSLSSSMAHTSNTVVSNMERRYMAGLEALPGKRKRRKPRD